MGAIEEFVQLMRTEGKQDLQPGIQMGIMTGATSLNLGGLPLTADDLMFNEGLLRQSAVSVAGAITGSGTSFQDKSTYMQPLKVGDQVAVIQVSDTLFFVLGKMVRA